MQNPKPRSGSSDVPQRTSPVTPRSTRVTRTGGHDSDSSSSVPTPTRTPSDRSPKVVERRSPRSPVTEKKRPSRISELESQITQLQEDLKKTKEQLSSSETWKRQAQQEAEEAKKQLQTTSAKLEDSQRELVEFSAAEEARLQELRKISQERDRAWQSEIEVIQKQLSVDSAALNSAMNEIQKLKLQLEMVNESEAAQTKQCEAAHSELLALKLDMAQAHAAVENLRFQLRDSEKAEAESQAMVHETQQQLEMAMATVEALRSDELKLRESFKTAAFELEKSRRQIKSLEEIVKNLHANKSAEEVDHDKLPQENGGGSLEQEVEQLRSALEAVEIKYEEQQTENTMQIRAAYELMERVKTDSGLRVAELESALKNAGAEIGNLKEKLTDKDREVEKITAMNKELNVELEQVQANMVKPELESKLMKSITDITELKANLMDKETELQSVLEENDLLRSEMEKKEKERRLSYEAAIAQMELAKAAEQEVKMRLGYVTEEADKNSRRAARVTEQLDAAQAMNSEMEGELRRLRVQSDQWRKAAEAAAAVLTTGNTERLMERTGSMDSEFSVAGKLMSSPFSDDLDDDWPKKKNNNVLRKIGGLWKKSPK